MVGVLGMFYELFYECCYKNIINNYLTNQNSAFNRIHLNCFGQYYCITLSVIAYYGSIVCYMPFYLTLFYGLRCCICPSHKLWHQIVLFPLWINAEFPLKHIVTNIASIRLISAWINCWEHFFSSLASIL